MRDATESNDDRLARRRARRWRRRAGLFAPFLAVPGMLVVLMLSINLIEHRPDARERARASQRAKPTAPPVAPARGAHPGGSVVAGSSEAGLEAGSLSQASVIENAVGADMPLSPGIATAASDATLFDAPAPTSAPGVGR